MMTTDNSITGNTNTEEEISFAMNTELKDRDRSCRSTQQNQNGVPKILLLLMVVGTSMMVVCNHYGNFPYHHFPAFPSPFSRKISPATSIRASSISPLFHDIHTSTRTDTDTDTGISTSERNGNENENVANTGSSFNILSTSTSTVSASRSASSASMTKIKIKEYEPRCNSRNGNHHTLSNSSEYEAPEPFAYLHDCCDDCNPAVEESPDPLVSMTWNKKSLGDSDNGNEDFVGIPLQIYRSHTPVKIWTIPADGCLMTEHERHPTEEQEPHDSVMSSATSTSTSATRKLDRNTEQNHPRMTVVSDCTIVMDWGSERAAWFEILSRDDLTKENPTATVTASISEFNRPYPGKTRELTKYGDRTYRLETNEELYEGVRFTFLHVEFLNANAEDEENGRGRGGLGNTLTIDDFSIVSKVKPIEYTGSFQSSSSVLARAYYWGAYGVRLNIEQSQLNSILIERGDRVAIQGDGHPTIATALEVFYGHETKYLLKNVLKATDNAHKHVVDDVIMAYPLYWCLSAMEYFWATYTDGDVGEDYRFVRQSLVNDISLLLDKRIEDFLDPNLDITWFGWDDRVGNGWCFHSKDDACTREGLLAFAGLVIRVCNDFVNLLLNLTPRDPEIPRMIQRYQNESKRMTQALRRVPEYPSGFGVHSAANAINALVATPEEIKQHWMGTTDDTNTLNNAVTVCSFSQFNQYFILQAYGSMEGGMEHALKSIELCWGPMMELSTGGCFWEISSPEWLRFMDEGDQAPHLPSYCHPWASGVTPWLSKLLGGLNPLRPGYQEFIAMPYVSGNYPSVSTTTATAYGPISVTARLTFSDDDCEGESCIKHESNESLESRALPPYKFEATIRSNVWGLFGIQNSLVSKSGIDFSLDVESIVVNGVPVTASEIIDVERASGILVHRGIQRVREHIFVVLDEHATHGVGSHTITATYDHPKHDLRGSPTEDEDDRKSVGDQNQITGTETDSQRDSSARTTNSFSPFPMPHYPATIDQDRDSQGDGLFVHGRDGFVMLGYNTTNMLGCCMNGGFPPYVESVKIGQHGYPGWVYPHKERVGFSDTDPVYLPLPEGFNTRWGKRFLGWEGIEDTGGGDINCLVIDVTIAGAGSGTGVQPYALSLYMVGMRPGNRHAIRVMDASTLEVIAPTTIVEDYTGGVWWTLHYDRSVRLKMMDIEGVHVSAIGFATDQLIPEVMRTVRNKISKIRTKFLL